MPIKFRCPNPSVTSDDRDVRREATTLLRQLNGNDRGTQLTLTLAALKGPDSGERDRALQDLGRSPAVEASRDEVLAGALPLLKAVEASTRRWALKVVEVWGTAEQVPTLIEAADDPDRGARAMAIAALGKIRRPQSALAIARMIENPATRREAADALVAMKFKDDEVEARVFKSLASTDAATRLAACQVLRAIGNVASVPALKKASADERRNVATAAARAALTAIDPEAKPDVPPAMPKARGASQEILRPGRP